MWVLAGYPPGHQRHGEQIRDRILRHRHLGERSVELREPTVGNGADEFGDPAEVVVDGHGRQPARGRDRARLDGGRSLLGKQPDRGLNEPFRDTVRRRIP